MKALTVTQPWATLIAIGAKRFETRSWSTLYRGPLAIHAGKGLGPVGGMRGLRELCATEPFRSVLLDYEMEDLSDPTLLPRGRVVATVALAGVRRVEELATPGLMQLAGAPLWERSFGDYSPGRFAWEMVDVVPARSAPVRGELGLWSPPCLSTNPHADEICELVADHDGLHRDSTGRTWNWGDS